MVAMALQEDGWYLRSDVIWAKPNPMPESVTDRPTKSHEYLFLLTKSARYFYDADAVREAAEYGRREWSNGRAEYDYLGTERTTHAVTGGDPSAGRNLRTVWTIATEPYPGAHFATFPQKLVEPCIKAGTSERGCCPECGAPWVRETSVEYVKSPVHGAGSVVGRHYETGSNGYDGTAMPRLNRSSTTTGWQPSCFHAAIEVGPSMWRQPIPCTVLDPFAGSGTTLMVAQRLSRRAIGIDLSADYLDQAMIRNAQRPLGIA